jgi:hypothetical protein
MRYRAIELLSNIHSPDPDFRTAISTQVERALEGVPREAIVSISYAPYPHEQDSMLVLIVLQED